MDVRLKAIITENRQLVIELPADIPTGEVEVILRPLEEPTTYATKREEVRQKLLKAGVLFTDFALLGIPEGLQPLTIAQRMELGTLPPDAVPSDVLVDIDRGEW